MRGQDGVFFREDDVVRQLGKLAEKSEIVIVESRRIAELRPAMSSDEALDLKLRPLISFEGALRLDKSPGHLIGRRTEEAKVGVYAR